MLFVLAFGMMPAVLPARALEGDEFLSVLAGAVVSGVNGGGQLYRVSDDGGIVYANNGSYIVAIMSRVPANHDYLNGLTSAIDSAHSEM